VGDPAAAGCAHGGATRPGERVGGTRSSIGRGRRRGGGGALQAQDWGIADRGGGGGRSGGEAAGGGREPQEIALSTEDISVERSAGREGVGEDQFEASFVETAEGSTESVEVVPSQEAQGLRCRWSRWNPAPSAELEELAEPAEALELVEPSGAVEAVIEAIQPVEIPPPPRVAPVIMADVAPRAVAEPPPPRVAPVIMADVAPRARRGATAAEGGAGDHGRCRGRGSSRSHRHRHRRRPPPAPPEEIVADGVEVERERAPKLRGGASAGGGAGAAAESAGGDPGAGEGGEAGAGAVELPITELAPRVAMFSGARPGPFLLDAEAVAIVVQGRS